MESTSNEKPSKWKPWLKRAGVAGFLFFLIKGLVWVGIAVAAYFSIKD